MKNGLIDQTWTIGTEANRKKYQEIYISILAVVAPRDVIPGFLAIPKFHSFPDSFHIPDTSRNGMRNDRNAGIRRND